MVLKNLKQNAFHTHNTYIFFFIGEELEKDFFEIYGFWCYVVYRKKSS